MGLAHPHPPPTIFDPRPIRATKLQIYLVSYSPPGFHLSTYPHLDAPQPSTRHGPDIDAGPTRRTIPYDVP